MLNTFFFFKLDTVVLSIRTDSSCLPQQKQWEHFDSLAAKEKQEQLQLRHLQKQEVSLDFTVVWKHKEGAKYAAEVETVCRTSSL